VIVISEIWTSNIQFYYNIFEGYNFYYSLPATNKTGGIGVYVKHNLKQLDIAQDKLTVPITDEYEDIWIKTSNDQNKYNPGCEYRHPNSHIDNFQAALENSLNNISSQQVLVL
jgi:hypothetical protein